MTKTKESRRVTIPLKRRLISGLLAFAMCWSLTSGWLVLPARAEVATSSNISDITYDASNMTISAKWLGDTGDKTFSVAVLPKFNVKNSSGSVYGRGSPFAVLTASGTSIFNAMQTENAATEAFSNTNMVSGGPIYFGQVGRNIPQGTPTTGAGSEARDFEITFDELKLMNPNGAESASILTGAVVTSHYENGRKNSEDGYTILDLETEGTYPYVVVIFDAGSTSQAPVANWYDITVVDLAPPHLTADPNPIELDYDDDDTAIFSLTNGEDLDTAVVLNVEFVGNVNGEWDREEFSQEGGSTSIKAGETEDDWIIYFDGASSELFMAISGTIIVTYRGESDSTTQYTLEIPVVTPYVIAKPINITVQAGTTNSTDGTSYVDLNDTFDAGYFVGFDVITDIFEESLPDVISGLGENQFQAISPELAQNGVVVTLNKDSLFSEVDEYGEIEDPTYELTDPDDVNFISVYAPDTATPGGPYTGILYVAIYDGEGDYPTILNIPVNITITEGEKVETATLRFHTNGVAGTVSGMPGTKSGTDDTLYTATTTTGSYTLPSTGPSTDAGTGWKFVGWHTAATYPAGDYSSGVFKKPGDTLSSLGSGTYDYYAMWECTVTAAAGAGGSVTLDGSSTTLSKSVLKGRSIALTATPNSGYSFQNWTTTPTTVTAPSQQNPSNVVVNAPATYTANFTQNTFGGTITTKLNDTNDGSVVTGTDEDSVALVPNTYDSLEDADDDVIVATGGKDTGTIGAWSYTGAVEGTTYDVYVNGTKTNQTVSNSSKDATVNFVTVTMATGVTGGSGAFTAPSTASPQYVLTSVDDDADRRVSISATAGSGYGFAGWSAEDSSLTSVNGFGSASTDSTTFTVPEDYAKAITITPAFTANKVTVNVLLNGSGAEGWTVELWSTEETPAKKYTATTSGNGAAVFESGTDGAIAAGTYSIYVTNGTNSAGAVWSGDTGRDITVADGVTNTHEDLYFYTVELDEFVTGDTSDPNTATIDSGDGPSTLLVGNEDHESVSLVAIPKGDYKFTGWTKTSPSGDSVGSFGNANLASTTWTIDDEYAGDGPIVLKPGFSLAYFSGTVKLQLDDDLWDEDTESSSRPTLYLSTTQPNYTAASGVTWAEKKTDDTDAKGTGEYEFSGATIDTTYYIFAGSSDSTATYTNVELTSSSGATVDYYTVSVVASPINGGDVEIKIGDDSLGTKVIVKKGTDVTIEATEASGYTFQNWSYNSSTLSNESETISNVDSGARTYTANFKADGISLAGAELNLYYGTHFSNTYTAESYDGDTPSYELLTETDGLPKWVKIDLGTDGAGPVTISGTPNKVTGDAGFTIGVKVTSDNGETDTATYTIVVNKAQVTVDLKEKGSGPYYVGDTTTDKVTTDVQGPYYNGDPDGEYSDSNWITLNGGTMSGVWSGLSSVSGANTTAMPTLTYTPSPTLTKDSDGNTSTVKVVVTPQTSDPTPGNNRVTDLSTVWSTDTDTEKLALTMSYSVTINVVKDGDDAYRDEEAVYLYKDGAFGEGEEDDHDNAFKKGELEENDDGDAATYTFENVPNGTYYVYIGDDTTSVATVQVSSDDVTITVNYYTLKISVDITDNQGTLDISAPDDLSEDEEGVYLAKTPYKVVATGNAGYHFEKWTTEEGATVSNPTNDTRDTTLTGRTILVAHFKPNALSGAADKTLEYTYADTVNEEVGEVKADGVTFSSAEDLEITSGEMPGGLELVFDPDTGKVTVKGRVHEVTTDGAVEVTYKVTGSNNAEIEATLTITVGPYNPQLKVERNSNPAYVGDPTSGVVDVSFIGPYFKGIDGERPDNGTNGWVENITQATTKPSSSDLLVNWTLTPDNLSASTTAKATILSYAGEDTVGDPQDLDVVWYPLEAERTVVATETVNLTIEIHRNGAMDTSNLRGDWNVEVKNTNHTRTGSIDTNGNTTVITVPVDSTYAYTVTITDPDDESVDAPDIKTIKVEKATTLVFDYYDVIYKDAPEGAEYDDETTPGSDLVLVGASAGSTVTDTVNLPDVTVTANNSALGWEDNPAVGNFGGTSTWTLSASPTDDGDLETIASQGGIELTPTLTATGVNVTVTIRKDGKADASVVTSDVKLGVDDTSGGTIPSSSNSGGVYTFTNVDKNKDYYVYVDDGYVKVTFNTGTTTSAYVDYYTVSVGTLGKGAAELNITTDTDDGEDLDDEALVVLKDTVIYMEATPADGYSTDNAKFESKKPTGGSGTPNQPSKTTVLGSHTGVAAATVKIVATTELTVSFSADALHVPESVSLVAIYHMGEDEWVETTIHNGEKSVDVTGPIELANQVTKGTTGATGNYTFTAGEDMPDYLEIKEADETTGKITLVDNERFTDNVGTYTFSVTVKDTDTQETATITVVLTIEKAKPDIKQINYIPYETQTHYYGDTVIQEGRLQEGTSVQDPYTGAELDPLNIANWSSNESTFQETDGTTEHQYTFTFKKTGENAGNYTFDTEIVKLKSIERSPNIQAGTVMEVDEEPSPTRYNTGDNPLYDSVEYSPTSDVITVTVGVGNIDHTSKSPINKLTATQKDAAATGRTKLTISSLTVDGTGNIVPQDGTDTEITKGIIISNSNEMPVDKQVTYTFQVDRGNLSVGVYEASFTIHAEAGTKGQDGDPGSWGEADTTYTYVLTVEAAKITAAATVDPPVAGEAPSWPDKAGEFADEFKITKVTWKGSDNSTWTSTDGTFDDSAEFLPGVSYTVEIEVEPIDDNRAFDTSTEKKPDYTVNDENGNVTFNDDKATLKHTFPALAVGAPRISMTLDTASWQDAYVDWTQVDATVPMTFYYVVTDTALSIPGSEDTDGSAMAALAKQIKEAAEAAEAGTSGNDMANQVLAGVGYGTTTPGRWDGDDAFSGDPNQTFYGYVVTEPTDGSGSLSVVGSTSITLDKKLTIVVNQDKGVTATNGGGEVTGTVRTGAASVDASNSSQTFGMRASTADASVDFAITPKNNKTTPDTDGWEIKSVILAPGASVTSDNITDDILDEDGDYTAGTWTYTHANAANDTTLTVTFHKVIYGTAKIVAVGGGDIGPGATITPSAATSDGADVHIGNTHVTNFASTSDLEYQWFVEDAGTTSDEGGGVGWKSLGAASATSTLVVPSNYPGKQFKVRITYKGDPGPGEEDYSWIEAFTEEVILPLDQPQPILSIVEVTENNDADPAQRPQGGLYMRLPKISQDTTGGPVIVYEVVLHDDTTGEDVATLTIEQKDIVSGKNYYEHYWPADLDDIIPGHKFTVTVTATTETSGYEPKSEPGEDTAFAGYRELTLADLAVNILDKPFNGAEQDGTPASGPIVALASGKPGAGVSGAIGTVQVTYADNESNKNPQAKKTHVNIEVNSNNPGGLTNDGNHSYYVYIEVAKGSLYLALTNTRYTKVDSDANRMATDWEIYQVKPTLTVQTSSTGTLKVNNPITVTPKVTYTYSGTDAWNTSPDGLGTLATAGDVTRYYSVTYTIERNGSPAASTDYDLSYTNGSDGEATFTPRVAGSYVIKATANYGALATDQFKADLATDTYDTSAINIAERAVTGLKLERYEAYNGTIGTDQDEDIVGGKQNKSENREVTYGDTDKAQGTTGLVGYYDASTAAAAKQMRLEGLRLTVTYDNGDVEVYVIGTTTATKGDESIDDYTGGLPAGLEWVITGDAGKGTDTASKDVVQFTKAGDADVSVKLTGTNTTSNVVDYVLKAKKLDYTTAGDNKPYEEGDTSVPNGRIVVDPDDVVGDDDVDITADPDDFYFDDDQPGTKRVRVRNPRLTGEDKDFYEIGDGTPGEATIGDKPEPPAPGTPVLKFSDGTTTWYEDNDLYTGAHHTPRVYLEHLETVNLNNETPSSSRTFYIAVSAEEANAYKVQVTAPGDKQSLLSMGTTLELVKGNTTTGGYTSPNTVMDQYNTVGFAWDDDLIIYQLTISQTMLNTVGTYYLELVAVGAGFADGAQDIVATYDFTLTVLPKQETPPPTVTPGPSTTVTVTETVELPVVTYWIGGNGYTNDLTAEKMEKEGDHPSFVPQVTGLNGYEFKGWLEVDPATLKEGEEPKLVDPLTFAIYEDKTFYAYYVKEGVDHTHYVVGYKDGTFAPQANITRAEVATIIARACLEGFEEGKDYGNPGNYSDVGATKWYASAIAYCTMNGVFQGYADGTFAPNQPITRQELANVVARMAGVLVDQGLPFTDASSVNKWARDGVYTTYAHGWIQGDPGGTFRPKDNMTRAEAVRVFNGYLNRGVDAEGLEGLVPYLLDAAAGGYEGDGTTEYLTWADVPKTHWAYYDILEASNDHDFHWTDKTETPPEDWDSVYLDEQWRYREEYTVTFDLRGLGTTHADTASKVVRNSAIKIAPGVAAAEGYTFLGWSETDPALGGAVTLVDPTTVPITGNKTFYAVYEEKGAEPEPEPATYMVLFVAGDSGELNGDPLVETRENTAPTVPTAAAAEGYTFLGWSETDPVLGDATLVNPASIIITGNKTYYAVYEAVEPEVTEPEEPETPEVTEPTEPEEPEGTEPETGLPDGVHLHVAYFDGRTDSTFDPGTAITRAEIATMIVRGWATDYDENVVYDVSGLSDIQDHPYRNYIGYCLENGIFSGYADGTFDPDGSITRQEFALVLARLGGILTNEGLPFTDADSIKKWARDGIYTAYVNGWMTGYADGSFRATEVVTRAQAVTAFNRFLGRELTRAGIAEVTEFDHTWTDIKTTNWAWLDVMEATHTHTHYFVDGVEYWLDATDVQQ